MAGKIYRYLADDHTRLKELLERVVTLPHGVKAEKITAPSAVTATASSTAILRIEPSAELTKILYLMEQGRKDS